jgi:protocadherin delta 1
MAPNTGVLSVKANIDYETIKSFTFKVKATDGGGPALVATATVTVYVTDVNDNNPVLSPTFVNTEVWF